MEATYSSETSVDFQRTTRRYIPEDRTAEVCLDLIVKLMLQICVCIVNLTHNIYQSRFIEWWNYIHCLILFQCNKWTGPTTALHPVVRLHTSMNVSIVKADSAGLSLVFCNQGVHCSIRESTLLPWSPSVILRE
jgi:hypothetical protein